MQPDKKAYWQLHTAIFFWGFTGVLGTEISVTAPALVWYRLFGTAIFIAITMTFLKKWHPIEKSDMRRLILVGILFGIHWLAFYLSIKMAGASIAMVCLATASIFTALLNPILNSIKLNKKEVLVGLIAMAGVSVMYIFQAPIEHNSTIKTDENIKLGIILGVIAAIISAIFTLLNKPLSQKYDHRNIVFYEMLFGGLFLSLFIPIYIPNVSMDQIIPKGMDYIWLLCLIYFCTVLGQQLVIQSLKKLNPFTVTLSVNIEPIYGVILAFLIHNENHFLGWNFYVGVVIIFISMILQIIFTQRNKKFPLQ